MKIAPGPGGAAAYRTWAPQQKMVCRPSRVDEWRGVKIADMTRRQFEALVEKSLRKLPRPFKEKIANIAVVVEDWADDATLEEMDIEPPDTLYGLYRGVDITQRDSTYGNVLPDVITIYQGPIEEDAADEAEMAEIVRETVMHELGHYFGLDDDTMHRIEDGEV
ncbi:MAG: hypothetical protein DMD78_15465 [Candidatus Rokuibacteriota bacterium]|nr:MAG: hypothetical protein DMD78_15465 [Candidatus Rokubacteria bacterium]